MLLVETARIVARHNPASTKERLRAAQALREFCPDAGPQIRQLGASGKAPADFPLAAAVASQLKYEGEDVRNDVARYLIVHAWGAL